MQSKWLWWFSPPVNYPRRHSTRDKCIHNLLLEHSLGVVHIHLNLQANFTPASGDVQGQYIVSKTGHPDLGQVNAGMASFIRPRRLPFYTLSNSLLIVLSFDAVPPKLDIDSGDRQTTDKRSWQQKSTHTVLLHIGILILRIFLLLLLFYCSFVTDFLVKYRFSIQVLGPGVA